MALDIREVRPEEHAAAGRAAAAGWAAVTDPGNEGRRAYLDEIADVASRAERTLVLVAVEDGRVVGSATVDLTGAMQDAAGTPPDAATLRMLGVEPAAQGRGVGRALILACLEQVRRHGKHLALLHTSSDLAAAIHLYEDLGFERDPARDHTFEDGFTLIAYRKAM